MPLSERNEIKWKIDRKSPASVLFSFHFKLGSCFYEKRPVLCFQKPGCILCVCWNILKAPFYLKYFLRIYLSKGQVRLMTCLSTDQNHLSGTSRHCFCVIVSGGVNIVRREWLLLSTEALSSCFYVCFILERNTGKSLFRLGSKSSEKLRICSACN